MEDAVERRRRLDRRRVGWSALAGMCSRRRRGHLRRAADRSGFQYIDRFEPVVLALTVGILICCVADAYLTQRILDRGGMELNPLMAVLIDWQFQGFVAVKYTITATCVLVLIAHIRLKLLGRVSVKQLLVGIQLMYLALVNYELLLLSA